LRESGSSHEVQEVLALALEPRGSIGHDSPSLGCSDLAAKVGLARLAELAFTALRGAVEMRLVLALGGTSSEGALTRAQLRSLLA
jgi:hypothetical protein